MALTFPTTSLKKPSGVTALPSGFKRPAFGTLYGFDAQGGEGGDDAPAFTNEYSVDFDGTDDYMDAGTSSDYSIIGGGTLSYWFNPSFTTSTYTESIGKRSTAGFQITNTLTGGSSLVISAPNHSFSGGKPTVTITNENQWYLLTLVFHSSGGATMYLNDGASGASGTGATDARTSYAYTEDASAPLYIARHPTSSTRNFTGLIDEVAIFSSELSAADVETIYNSGTPNDISSLSPVGWWRMGDNDSGTGTTITDQGSGGNDGTLTNGPTFSSGVPYVLPAITNDYSVDFDGTDDVMTIPQGTFDIGTGNYTFSIWVRPTNISSTTATLFLIEGTVSGSTERLGLFMRTGEITLSDWFHNNMTYSTTVSNNTWYHIAAVRNPGATTNVHLYVNGTKVLEGNLDNTPNLGTDSRVATVGDLDTAGAYPFEGQLDEFSFWKSALFASDITAIYNGGQPADLTSLSPVGWWRMGDGTEDGSGTTVYDMRPSGTPNNGTLGGGPTYSSTTP